MSWRDRADLGKEIIAHVNEAIHVDEQWSVDYARGFIWWAEEFAQNVWADVGMFFNAQSIFRIHAETDLLKGRGRAQQFEVALFEFMKNATFSGVVYDAEKDTYKLHCSVYASGDNAEWMDKLFMAAVALQVAEAHEIGHNLARHLQATPATTGHPDMGIRARPHNVVSSVEEFFKPAGAQPSKWLGVSEWKETEWAMDRQALRFNSDHQTCLQAEFTWSVGEGAILLDVTTQEPHPVLGNGLMLRLTLPMKMSREKASHCALELNQIERKEWLRCQFMGSWGVGDGGLQYECFVPNTSYNSNILEALSLTMAIRAEWVNGQFSQWFAAAQRPPVQA